MQIYPTFIRYDKLDKLKFLIYFGKNKSPQYI